MKIKYKSATCRNCGWVGFEVSRKFAENEVKDFNVYFDSLSREDQLDFYGGHKSNISHYEQCFNCKGSYTNFRDTTDGDCPIGVTLNPIIARYE